MRPTSSSTSLFMTSTLLSASTSERSQPRKKSIQKGRVSKADRERREREQIMAKLRRMIPQNPEIMDCSELALVNGAMNYIIYLTVCLLLTVNRKDRLTDQ
ncbi:unnamed protein product [Gongylonema pulchrum]|uniref:BHLH domain-containing protein n=1 Tax=Gongylonema pulchrum TaxID=637853 RepID=A0A183DND3_9BILA|nr:unnamed protein product [Gongylonema pulchrum]